MKTALIQLTHQKAIDFLREMEEADLIRVLNISRIEDDKGAQATDEALTHSTLDYLHDPYVEEEPLSDYPGFFPSNDPTSNPNALH